MNIRYLIVIFAITIATCKTWALNSKEKALIKKASQHLASDAMYSEQELIDKFDEQMYKKLKKMFTNVESVRTKEMIYMTYIYSTADKKNTEVRALKNKIDILLNKSNIN